MTMTDNTPNERRDWDYVAFDDYRSDMAESTERAVAAIEFVKREAEQARRALAEVVLAAGGSVSVPNDVLRDPRRKVELTVCRNDYERTIEFRAVRTPT